MSEKIENILSKFDKTELAFFKRYKLKTYSLSTQKVINSWILRFGLTQNEIDDLIDKNEFVATNKSTKRTCPRCGSEKLFNSEKEIYDNRRSAMLESASYRQDIETVNIKICSVCGFNLDKDKKPGLFRRLFSKI